MNKLFLSLGLTMALVLSNCSSADKANSISPADADALTEVLVIPNAQVRPTFLPHLAPVWRQL